ncbi:MAG: SDR family NAD(P)-dependent oxidoreductase [Deltaproteobacteria bacterium]|nr:SDR family NAD(P)-dependent oxidoreductase [Deltaproteobacteria bacterium]
MTILSGKIAIITGASAGIGYATAKLFAREGAKLVVGARRQPELTALVAEIAEAGGSAIALAGDVKDEAFAKALVELATSRFGGLDIAFNNAGTLGELGLSVPDIVLSGGLLFSSMHLRFSVHFRRLLNAQLSTLSYSPRLMPAGMPAAEECRRESSRYVQSPSLGCAAFQLARGRPC